MADKKISELTAATTVNDGDQLPLVQSGDTLSLEASVLRAYVTADSTLVKVDVNQVLSVANSITERGHYSKGAFNGTYTDGIVLDYVTGKGRISVGSSDGLSIYNGGVGGTALLNLDSSGNLGLGTATAAWSGWKAIQVSSITALASYPGYSALGFNWYGSASGDTYVTTNYASRYLQFDGKHAWYTAPSGTAGSAISFTQAMTLDASGNLGIGTTSPQSTLHVQKGNGLIRLDNGDGNYSTWQQTGSDTRFGSQSAIPLAFYTNGTERARIDSSGNLGLGVTPSAWNSGYKSIQFFDVTSGSIANSGYASSYQTNAWINSSNQWIYGGGSYAPARYLQFNGQHAWYNAVSGTAGSAISFTQAMTLDASGNLGIGTSSPGSKLEVYSSSFAIAKINAATTSQSALLVTNNSEANRFYFGIDTSSGGAFGAGAYGRVLYSDGAYPMVFYTNGSERARLDSSGNLGLGVTPSGWSGFKALQINNGGFASYLNGTNTQTAVLCNAYFDGGSYRFIASTQATYYNQDNGLHKWFNSNNTSGTAGAAWTPTQAMTLDASGRLSIGATSASNLLTVGSAALGGGIDIFSTGSDSHFYRYSADGYPPAFIFQKSRAGAAVQSGDGLGQIYFSGYDGSSWQLPVSIWSVVTGPVSAGSIPSALIFGTSSTTYPTERARIDSSGNFLVGTTSTATNGVGIFASPNYGGVSGNGVLYIGTSGSNNTYTPLIVYSTGASANRFYVDASGTIHATSTSITAISDISLKENIRPLETGLAEILKLQPRRFDWKNGDGTDVAGFIAQEVEPIFPDLVSDYKYNDEETKKAVKMGDMIPSMVRAIQEQHEMILALSDELEQVKSTLH